MEKQLDKEMINKFGFSISTSVGVTNPFKKMEIFSLKSF
jgi:hypothetical protein